MTLTRMCRLDVSDHGWSERRRWTNVYKRLTLINYESKLQKRVDKSLTIIYYNIGIYE